jgi:hypothetical protein
MEKLSQDQCRQMIADGEIPEEIRSSASKVAVILTQSWCPDWLVMQRYLNGLDQPDVKVFYVEYDREACFHEVMAFKETVFGNFEVPYVRYFQEGRLVNQSNLVFTKRGFLKKLSA